MAYEVHNLVVNICYFIGTKEPFEQYFIDFLTILRVNFILTLKRKYIAISP